MKKLQVSCNYFYFFFGRYKSKCSYWGYIFFCLPKELWWHLLHLLLFSSVQKFSNKPYEIKRIIWLSCSKTHHQVYKHLRHSKHKEAQKEYSFSLWWWLLIANHWFFVNATSIRYKIASNKLIIDCFSSLIFSLVHRDFVYILVANIFAKAGIHTCVYVRICVYPKIVQISGIDGKLGPISCAM